MIKMSNVNKKYNNGITALNELSIEIEQGEFVYVVGPSGAGKSTFIKMIYHEEVPTEGYVTINEYDTSNMKNKYIPKLRRDVGVVFQDFKLLPKLTVFENVAYAMQVLEKHPKEIQARVLEVLELVGLKHKVRMFPHELSGGEQQRVAIARAVANTPKILIADEPTGNLDPDTSWGIMEVLDEINKQGTTVIMATHNSDIVNQVRHRVIAIDNGRIARDQEKGGYEYEV